MRDARHLLAPALFLLAAALVLTALAVAQPFALTGLSVVALGPLHVLLALRYLAGRAWPVLGGGTGRALAGLLLAMVLVRLVTVLSPQLGHHLELIGSALVLGFAVWTGLQPRLRVVGLALVAATTVASLVELPWYWHLLTHGHNLVPLIFLWDWSRRCSRRARFGFVTANLIWAVGIPALILTGTLDPLINRVPPAFVPGASFLVESAAPPGADPALGLRFLVAFGFLQAMHYVLWMVFFQVGGRAEIGRLVRGVPAAGGWRFLVIALAVCGGIWATYAVGYLDGRAVYGVLGALNVYLEQPIAVWLLLGALPGGRTTALVGRLRNS